MTGPTTSQPLGERRAVAPMTLTLFVILLFVRCATLANTPAQERSMAATRKCETEVPGVRVTVVRADGSFEWNYSSPTDYKAFMTCMRQQGYRFPTQGD